MGHFMGQFRNLFPDSLFSNCKAKTWLTLFLTGISICNPSVPKGTVKIVNITIVSVIFYLVTVILSTFWLYKYLYHIWKLEERLEVSVSTDKLEAES